MWVASEFKKAVNHCSTAFFNFKFVIEFISVLSFVIHVFDLPLWVFFSISEATASFNSNIATLDGSLYFATIL